MPLVMSLRLHHVRYHIIFKICTITYHAFSYKQLLYLHSLLTHVRKPSQLRSSSSDILFVAKVNTSIGSRAFAVHEPSALDMLPSSVESVEDIVKFCCHLKTYLYNLA